MKNGWQTKTIGDVCEFQRGLTYAKGDEVDVSDNVVLRATNIDLATNLLIFDELKYINAKVIVPESKKVKKGSLMICTASGSKSHLGKVALIDEDYGYAFGGFMGMLTPQNGLLPKYLFHLMTTEDYKDFIGALSDGANINNLTFDNLKRFPVPFPPLDEQKRIVAKLDEAFVGLAKAKENAEKNLQNARALFESHLESVFTQRGKGWVEKRLDALTAFSQGIQVGLGDQSNVPSKGLVRFIRIIDYTQGTHDIRYVSDPGRRYWVDKSDIVMVRYGTPGLVGRGIEGVIANNLFKISILGSSLTNDFLAYFLGQQTVQKYLSSQGSSTMPALTFTQLGAVLVSFPHELEEQKEIATKLDALREETQRLARIYEQKLEALESLKKSILHEAFSGNL